MENIENLVSCYDFHFCNDYVLSELPLFFNVEFRVLFIIFLCNLSFINPETSSVGLASGLRIGHWNVKMTFSFFFIDASWKFHHKLNFEISGQSVKCYLILAKRSIGVARSQIVSSFVTKLIPATTDHKNRFVSEWLKPRLMFSIARCVRRFSCKKRAFLKVFAWRYLMTSTVLFL